MDKKAGGVRRSEVAEDDVVGGASVEEDFSVGSCEAFGRVCGAIVAEAEGDGFGAVVVGFEDGGPEALDLL